VLLASLKRGHRSFVFRLLDSLLEEVLRSLERNDFKEAQRRVALAKFFGEAFNYRVIGTQTLFDLMYRIINYDWLSASEDKYFKNYDSNNDSFRIRIICTILVSF